MTQSAITNLRANEYSQKMHYYLFAVNLDMLVGWLVE